MEMRNRLLCKVGCCGYTYTDEELEKLKGWTGHKPTCVLFNNTSMKQDALRFKGLLKGRRTLGSGGFLR